MIERGKDFRLTVEAQHAVSVAGEGFRQDFQRHVSAKPRVPRDTPHPSRPRLGVRESHRAQAAFRQPGALETNYSPVLVLLRLSCQNVGTRFDLCA
jgi:hypothetical protein